MCTAKKNIIIPFIYFEKDVISGAGYLSVYLWPKQGELWCCTFLRTFAHNPHLSGSSALLFGFRIPALWLAETEELGGSGGSLKVREAGL